MSARQKLDEWLAKVDELLAANEPALGLGDTEVDPEEVFKEEDSPE